MSANVVTLVIAPAYRQPHRPIAAQGRNKEEIKKSSKLAAEVAVQSKRLDISSNARKLTYDLCYLTPFQGRRKIASREKMGSTITRTEGNPQ
jgi:hypothetical protein